MITNSDIERPAIKTTGNRRQTQARSTGLTPEQIRERDRERKRRAPVVPIAKTREEMAANAAAFHRWQRGETVAPSGAVEVERFVLVGR